MRLPRLHSLLFLALFASCRSASVRAAHGNISAHPSALDFGTTAPGLTVVQTTTIFNQGIDVLHIDPLAIDGAQATFFKAEAAGAPLVQSGAKLTLTVTYAPTAEGSHTARLLVRSDAGNTKELAIALTGRAAVNDLCAKITCDNPPGFCVQASGTCTAGQCKYTPKDDGTECSNGDLCTHDLCKSGVCQGTPIACRTPPAATCSSETTLVSSASPGTCTAGICDYPKTTSQCSGGCAGNVCTPDPCLNKICNSPPPCFKASGVCVDGTCQYEPDVGATCTSGNACEDGKTCDANGICAGAPTICQKPPPPVCKDSQTVTTFDVGGTCAKGVCSYTNHATACPVFTTCANGICASKQVLLATGRLGTCAVTSSGGLKCWGINNSGQIGDNSQTERNTPVDVVGLTSGVVAVSVGAAHTCALTSTGGVKCWGYNGNGQLGDGTTNQTARVTPSDVPALTAGVVAMSAASGDSTCVLTTAAGVKCWGRNDAGQVGDGTTTNPRTSPTDVLGLTGVISLSSAEHQTCALTSGGGVKCWGVGFGSTPVGLAGFSSGVSSVAPGFINTQPAICAVMNGGVQCSAMDPLAVPAGVSGITPGVVAVTVGNPHACVLTSSGGAKCWGRNDKGELGDNTTNSNPFSAMDVQGLTSGLLAVVAGFEHSCAVKDDGSVWCWGANALGQLGDNTTADRHAPVLVNAQF